ncbi:MAG: hypothetical protein ABGX12_04325 [Desulfurobacteriaceae bacterium]
MKNLLQLLITAALGLFIVVKTALAGQDWIGAFTTDSVPVKGCYVVKSYGIYWQAQYFKYVQWSNFQDDDNYLFQFGKDIDLLLENIGSKVKKGYPEANALLGVDFKFVTNYEPLVSKNYYINGKRADGIGWGAIILTGTAVKVRCRK